MGWGGGGEAEDPVGGEPWTRPAVAMGTAGRRRRAEAGCPAGQFRVAPANGREWLLSRHLGPRFPGRRSHDNSPLSERGDHKSPAAV